MLLKTDFFNISDLKIPFPVLILRNCLLVLEKDVIKKLSDLNIKQEDIFNDTDALINQIVKNNSSVNENVNFESEKEELKSFGKFLQSPFLKPKRNITELFNYIVKYLLCVQQKLINFLEVHKQKNLFEFFLTEY